MIRPIRAATRVAAAVASGNAADIAVTRRRDEIGGLLTSLATMQANLRSREAQALDLLQDKDRTAKALGLINLQFDTALNNMSVGLLMCDGTLRIAVVNHRFCAIFGLDFASIPPGSSYRDLLALSVSAGNYPGRTVDEILAARTPLFEARQARRRNQDNCQAPGALPYRTNRCQTVVGSRLMKTSPSAASRTSKSSSLHAMMR